LPWVYRKYNQRNRPEFYEDDQKPSSTREDQVDTFCDNVDQSTIVPLPDTGATTEQVEELKVGISRLEAKLDMLCSKNE